MTWFGEATGHLPGVYFVYWLATLAAFGVGTAWLALHWLPPRAPAARARRSAPRRRRSLFRARHVPAARRAGAAEPARRLPRVRGRCRADYGPPEDDVRARGRHRHRAHPTWSSRRGRAVLVALVRHGAVAATYSLRRHCVLPCRHVRSGVFPPRSGVRQRGHARRVQGRFDRTLQRQRVGLACRTRWLVDRRARCRGRADASREWRVLVPVLVIPAAIDMLGYLADRGDWGSLGEFAQRLFVYRLGMLLAPFVPWLVVLLAASAERRMGPPLRARSWRAPSVRSGLARRSTVWRRSSRMLTRCTSSGSCWAFSSPSRCSCRPLRAPENWRTDRAAGHGTGRRRVPRDIPILVLSHNMRLQSYIPGWIDVGYRGTGDGNVAIGKRSRRACPSVRCSRILRTWNGSVC